MPVPTSRRLQTGQQAEAVSAAAESLALSHRAGDSRIAIESLSLLGSLAAREPDPGAAARLLGAAEAERLRVGLSLAQTQEGELQDRTLEELRGELEVEAFEAAFAEGRSLSLEQAVEYAVNWSSGGGKEIKARIPLADPATDPPLLKSSARRVSSP